MCGPSPADYALLGGYAYAATARPPGGQVESRGAGVASSLATAPTTAHPRLQQVLGPLLQGWNLLRAILQVPPATRTRADGLGNEITVHMHSVPQLTETWFKKNNNKIKRLCRFRL